MASRATPSAARRTSVEPPFPSQPLRGTVHLHPIPLDSPIPCFHELLSPDERHRASRLSDPLRSRFVTARATLRRILGAYLDCSPGELRFSANPHGKPSLAFPDSNLFFNLSHSGPFAIAAISSHAPVGIDIEVVRPLPDLLELSSRFFAPAEHGRLIRLPAKERLRAFLECWTRKEALLKAVGTGIAHGLDGFEVGFGPGIPAALIQSSIPGLRAFHLSAFECPPDLIGAAALPHSSFDLRWH